MRSGSGLQCIRQVGHDGLHVEVGPCDLESPDTYTTREDVAAMIREERERVCEALEAASRVEKGWSGQSAMEAAANALRKAGKP